MFECTCWKALDRLFSSNLSSFCTVLSIVCFLEANFVWMALCVLQEGKLIFLMVIMNQLIRYYEMFIQRESGFVWLDCSRTGLQFMNTSQRKSESYEKAFVYISQMCEGNHAAPPREAVNPKTFRPPSVPFQEKNITAKRNWLKTFLCIPRCSRKFLENWDFQRLSIWATLMSRILQRPLLYFPSAGFLLLLFICWNLCSLSACLYLFIFQSQKTENSTWLRTKWKQQSLKISGNFIQ